MGWWDNKIGAPAPRQQVQAPVHPANLPQGMGLNHGAVIDRYMDQRTGVQQPQGPAPTGAQFEQQGMWTEEVPPLVDEEGKLQWRRWGGDMRAGAGESTTTGKCPSCGSNQYFSRSNAEGGTLGSGGIMDREGRKVYPRPECFACGYPRQQGALGVPVKMIGNSIAARQGEAPPPPGSLQPLRPR